MGGESDFSGSERSKVIEGTRDLMATTLELEPAVGRDRICSDTFFENKTMNDSVFSGSKTSCAYICLVALPCERANNSV